jgi:hypothetical protein
LGCTTKEKCLPFGYRLHLLAEGHQGPLHWFFGVFIPEEDDDVGDKVSRGTTMVDIQTLLEALFEHVACFTDEAFFLIKSKTSGPGTILLKCQIIRFSGLSDDRLK